MSRRNRGHFRTSFLPVWLPKASHLLATPHGPTALVRAQEAEENHLLPARVFAWFRHLGHTLPCQGRAGASESRRAQRLLVLAHRALVLALTAGVDCAGQKRAAKPFLPHALFGGPRSSGRSANTSSIVASGRFVPPRVM